MRLLEFAKLARPQFEFDFFHEMLFHLLEGDDNLLVSLPPGSGKTELVMIIAAAWIVAEAPTRSHIIALSNAEDLARLACSNAKRVLSLPEIEERFPMSFSKETETSFTVEGGDGRPAMHAAGIYGQVTGMRATHVLVDDVVKNLEVCFSPGQLDKIWSNYQAVAETCLLPKGRVIAIGTRWSQNDLIGRLLERALANPKARQFTVVNLAATNDTGAESFVLDTRTNEQKFLPKYSALARKAGQTYSFSREELDSKRADIGPNLWSALYQGQPLAAESQLFPPDCWGEVGSIETSRLGLVVTAWDCASKTGASNDFSANVVVGGTADGRLVVLDAWKGKADFADLPAIILARYQALATAYNTVPLLAVEDANAGTQVLQVFEAQAPQLPKIAVKPAGRSKIVRAEGVTPYTRGRLVDLPKSAPWREMFVSELANFPVGRHDDLVDAMVWAIKAFMSGAEFRRPDRALLTPGPTRRKDEVEADMLAEYLELKGGGRTLCPDLDEIDRPYFEAFGPGDF